MARSHLKIIWGAGVLALVPSIVWANYSMAQDIVYGRPVLILLAFFIEMILAGFLFPTSKWKAVWVVFAANVLTAFMGAGEVFDMFLDLIWMVVPGLGGLDRWGTEMIRLGWGFLLSVGFEGALYYRYVGPKGFRSAWIMNGASYLMFIVVCVVWGLPPSLGRMARNQATSMALDSLDSALERFRIDFKVYPTLEEHGVEHSADQWRTLSRALGALGTAPEKMFHQELRQVLHASVPHLNLARPMPVDRGYHGPYLKAGKDGVKFDGWKRPFVLIVDNRRKSYRLYSVGANGRDEGGEGDDMVSNSSGLLPPHRREQKHE